MRNRRPYTQTRGASRAGRVRARKRDFGPGRSFARTHRNRPRAPETPDSRDPHHASAAQPSCPARAFDFHGNRAALRHRVHHVDSAVIAGLQAGRIFRPAPLQGAPAPRQRQDRHATGLAAGAGRGCCDDRGQP
ncbi:hypothetical protein GLE_5134 [Lysobacter enzymogenes]|uniref:Uncharacterized protein n=1 Tax=Lysobacter enzymogenes TaxID=69 RepID=A0A0S2DP33_LYSEN|nr:hypothetical protein GLE_5134 [Lysobacter enzymogenes]